MKKQKAEFDPYHMEFLDVLEKVARLRLEKVRQYGTSRYEIQDLATNRWLAYSDVLRKFIRLQEQMRSGGAEDLLETYQDLASYALMAVQLLSREVK